MRAFAVFAGLLIFQTEVLAQGLMDAYRLARDNDPRYKAAQLEFKAAEQVLRQAHAGFRPVVKADLERTHSNQRIIKSNNPIFGEGRTEFPVNSYTLSLIQPLFRKDVIERLEQAEAVVKQAHFTLLAAEQDMLQRTASAYLAVLAATDSLELARAEKDAVRRHLELAEGRLKGGLGTVTNYYDAAARYAVDQAKEIEAENKLADVRQALREITGRSLDSFPRLREDAVLALPQPADLNAWIERAKAQNLVLQARSQAVQVAFQEIQRQRAGHFPSLNLVTTYNHRESGSTLFGGGSTTATADFTLRFNIPIYEGGLTSAVTAEASFRHQKAQEDREQELRSVERQTRAAYLSVVSGTNLVQALRQAMLSQQKALEAKETGARSGVFTLIAVLDAQRDLFIARRDYAQARYEYLLNSLKLKQAAGILAEDDLLAVNTVLQ